MRTAASLKALVFTLDHVTPGAFAARTNTASMRPSQDKDWELGMAVRLRLSLQAGRDLKILLMYSLLVRDMKIVVNFETNKLFVFMLDG